ncbi:MAG TPA: response regulator [Gaiellaceae bacterium]
MSALAVPFVFGRGPDDDSGQARAAARARLSVVGEAEGGAEGAKVLRVLLVEDDPSMRFLCSFNLDLEGFEVVEAGTGEEALAQFNGTPFDLVLLDVMLPDFSGLEVAARLRAGARTREVPIVFVSARGGELDIEHGRAAGAIDYIVKPFDPIALPQRLRGDLEELGRSGAEGVWRLRFGSGRAGM